MQFVGFFSLLFQSIILFHDGPDSLVLKLLQFIAFKNSLIINKGSSSW